jgi:hypothetical protein
MSRCHMISGTGMSALLLLHVLALLSAVGVFLPCEAWSLDVQQQLQQPPIVDVTAYGAVSPGNKMQYNGMRNA